MFATTAAATVLAGTGLAYAAKATATPSYCPGGGVITPIGSYCDGKPFADNTKWHQTAVDVPGVGRVWSSVMCVVADSPVLVPAKGCGGIG